MKEHCLCLWQWNCPIFRGFTPILYPLSSQGYAGMPPRYLMCETFTVDSFQQLYNSHVSMYSHASCLNLQPSKKKHSENSQVPCDPEAREIAATAQLSPPGKKFCLEDFLPPRNRVIITYVGNLLCFWYIPVCHRPTKTTPCLIALHGFEHPAGPSKIKNLQ